VKWREAYVADMLVEKFADVIIVHNVGGWALLPPVVTPQNIHNDRASHSQFS
jgi:CO dehydrogenase/acetyl-CoA synthase gamma subunit (corrinoid Fe-S protein)